MICGILKGYLVTFRTILLKSGDWASYLGPVTQEFLMRGYRLRDVRCAVALMDTSPERQELLFRLRRVRKFAKPMEGLDVTSVTHAAGEGKSSMQENHDNLHGSTVMSCHECRESQRDNKGEPLEQQEDTDWKENLSETSFSSDSPETNSEEGSCEPLLWDENMSYYAQGEYQKSWGGTNTGGKQGSGHQQGEDYQQGGGCQQQGGQPDEKYWNGQH